MAKKKKQRQQVQRQELNDEQLEAVSGGLNFAFPGGVTVASGDVNGGATQTSSLMKACATGEHIKKAILTG